MLLDHGRNIDYSAIYGSNLVGPFSGSDNWAKLLISGQSFIAGDGDVVEWVIWPWSMFSMLLCEFGIIPTLGLIALIGYRLNYIWYISVENQSTVKWYTLSTLIGLFLAPKWCVYFFFFPLFSVDRSILKNA